MFAGGGAPESSQEEDVTFDSEPLQEETVDAESQIYLQDSTISPDVPSIISSIDGLKDAGSSEELISLIEKVSDYEMKYGSIEVEAAVIISSELKDFEPIDPTELENYDSFKKHMHKVNRVSDLINEHTDKDFGHIGTTRTSYDKFIATKTKYIPLINSYNELINASKDLDPEDMESVRHFYICLFLVGVDIALIQTGAMYKGAFASVGALNGHLGLNFVVPYIGYSGYGLLLSSIHWTLRGYIEGFKNDVFDTVRKEIDDQTMNKIDRVTEKGKELGSEIENLSRNFTKNLAGIL